jgi:hypothetical protein
VEWAECLVEWAECLVEWAEWIWINFSVFLLFPFNNNAYFSYILVNYRSMEEKVTIFY